MQLVEIGLDYATADVHVRERLAVSSTDLPDVLADLHQIAADVVILSTCNRVELYLVVEEAAAGTAQVLEYLARRSGLSLDQVRAATRQRAGIEAVRHLCRVATGLESMIIGEPEIAGQVRTALRAAEEAGTMSVVTRRLFDDALGVAGQVRASSGIARHSVSVSAAAVRLGERTLGGLTGKVGLVIGAGSVGRAAARVMSSAGASCLLVASRRIVSARQTAAEVGGQAVEMEQLHDALTKADLVVTATSAPHVIVRADVVRDALAVRHGRPLVIVDVAVPRDVEPEVGNLDGCSLFDVDDLATAREASLAARRLAASDAEVQIERTVERFMSWLHGRTVAATVTNLVAHAERIRQAEVQKSLARFGADVTDRERALVESASAAIVKKLLHQPIVQLKRRGADAESEIWAQALGELFALPNTAITAIGAAPSANAQHAESVTVLDEAVG
jgi:glutamyl-tRNA reductase